MKRIVKQSRSKLHKNATSCFEHPIIQLYGHLPPISQTIQIRKKDKLVTSGEVRTILLTTFSDGFPLMEVLQLAGYESVIYISFVPTLDAVYKTRQDEW